MNVVLRQATKLREGDVLALPFHRTATVLADPKRDGDVVRYPTTEGPGLRSVWAMVPIRPRRASTWPPALR